MTKSKMTDTNEKKWKDDFVAWWIENHDDTTALPRAYAWQGYLAARKKAHSEREDAFKAFTLDLADRYEKEIELLKAELKAEQQVADYCLNLIVTDDEPTEEQCDKLWSLARSTVKNRRIVL